MEENPITRTTRRMAYALMGLFAVCLVTTLIVAVCFKDEAKWFSAFKDGFAFLAGALATIIGYYFGNKNTEVALERAREATEKANDASEKVRQEEAKTDALKKEILDVTERDDPRDPIESAFTTEGELTVPQNKK